MFGIGETELVIIVVFAFLLFGPDKLPGMGRTLGRVLRQFREASDGFSEVVQTNIMDPAAEELEKSPKQRKRDAGTALDADVDAREAAADDTGPQAPQRETFAERRARLAAERKAQEAAAATEGAAFDAASAEEGAAPDAAGAEEGAAAQGAAAADGEAAEHAGEAQGTADAAQGKTGAQDIPPSSAADLYALGPRKSSRARMAEKAAAEAVDDADVDDEAAAGAEAVQPAGTEPAGESADASVSGADDSVGEEDGSSQA